MNLSLIFLDARNLLLRMVNAPSQHFMKTTMYMHCSVVKKAESVYRTLQAEASCSEGYPASSFTNVARLEQWFICLKKAAGYKTGRNTINHKRRALRSNEIPFHISSIFGS